jgi:MFS family permease
MTKRTAAAGTVAPARRGVLAWRNAVLAVFILNGFEFSSWVSRIPGVRDSLHLRDADVGLLLLCISAGAILGLVSAPSILARLGSRRGIVTAIGFGSVGLVLAGVGASTFHLVPMVAIGLAMVGFGNGAVDVMMNVEGTMVERAKGTTQMPLMHAGYSLGTVVGAGIGAAAAALQIDTSWHLSAVAVVAFAGVIVAVRFFGSSDFVLPPRPAVRTPMRTRLAGKLVVWTDVALILIGVVMLGMAFTEGSAGDWLALAVVDGHHQSNSTGALYYGLFVAAMTVARVLGGPLVDRVGRVIAIRATAGLGVIGLLMFIIGGPLWVVAIGTVLWGFGCALGFPLGMSAAADNTDHPAERVSAVAMIGYCAFLVGPPVMGFLAQSFGILHALYLVLFLLALSALFAGALRHRTNGAGTAAEGEAADAHAPSNEAPVDGSAPGAGSDAGRAAGSPPPTTTG